MQTEQRYKVAAYCRLSSDDGNQGDSSSIITQKLMIEKFCKEQGFIIHDYFIDDGFSGLNFNRPAFQKMIKDIENKEVNLVITKDLSRLGRNYIETGHYTEIFFQSKGVRYIAINDGIDTDKENNDIAPFKNILNDLYAKDLSRKVKSAKKQRALNGMFISSQTPFGYKKNPDNLNQLVIDEEAAGTVKEIYNSALLGKGIMAICKELKARKIITPAAFKAKNGDTKFERYYNKKGDDWQYEWCTATVRKILNDIVYIGDMENRKYEVQNYKTKKRVRVPDEKHIIVKNTHEAIISRDDFTRVQELTKAKNYPARHNKENIFKGLVYCANCGRRLALAVKVRKSGLEYIHYKCNLHYEKPDMCPHHNNISYQILKDIVTLRIKEFFILFNNEESINYFIKLKTSQVNDNTLILKEINKSEERLNMIIKVVKKLYEDYSSEKIDEDTYDRLLFDYQKEQKELQLQLTNLKNQIEEQKDYKQSINILKDIINEVVDFDELTEDIVYKLISRIDVDYTKEVDGVKTREIKITYRFIDMAI